MSEPTRKRLPADERRTQIVASAFGALAELGFEGLRMRDVAQKVGINSATIHHYFPTKQDLIAAVAQYLAEQFSAHRAPPIVSGSDVPPCVRELRQEFADAMFYRSEFPELLLVSRELTLRARRDTDIASVTAPLNEQWCAAIERIIIDGQRSAVFRDDVAPLATSRTIVAALWGMSTLLDLSAAEFADACTAIERMLRVN